MTLFLLIIYLGYLLLVLNTLFYFRSFSRGKFAFRTFSIFLLTSLVLQIFSYYLSFLKENNLFLSHYYFIGHFILLSIFFSKVLRKKNVEKFIYFAVGIILFILGLYYVCYPEAYYTFNLLEIVLTSVPLIVYCFLFFIQEIAQRDKKYIYLVSGLFLYLLGSTLLFTAGNIISKAGGDIIWSLNASLYLLYQILIFTEWYVNFRKLSSLSQK